MKKRKTPLTSRQERDLVQSLEAKKELLPYLPELLLDLWELGSFPSLYVDTLRPLSLDPDKTKVLDLGTGKGAVAVTLARELGFCVVGVDLFEPFLEEAKIQAQKKGVIHLCQFYCEDIFSTLKRAKNYDLVLFISIGGLLGNWKRTVGRLRKTVRPGGYILIDDGFYKEGHRINRVGYRHYASHEKTLESLTSFGDTLIKELIYPDSVTAKLNWGYTESIKRRARPIFKDNPEMAESLHWYIRNQEEENRIIETSITGACWLIQRGE